MAYVKRTVKRKIKPRKTYKRKPAYKKANVTVFKPSVSLGKGFPSKLSATLKYREYVYLNASSGILSNYLFSANGLFDPNTTGGGHQPMFFDQYMALYNHYHVIGSKCKVTFVHSAGVSTNAGAVGIFLNDDTTTLATTYTAMDEQTQSKMKILGSSTTDDRETVTCMFSPKRIYGPSLLSNNALRGNSGANPSEQSYFNIYAQSLDSLSSLGIYAWVEIEYIAVFTELKDFAQS